MKLKKIAVASTLALTMGVTALGNTSATGAAAKPDSRLAPGVPRA